MIVNEIFQSIEGEGKRAGSIATFIRLAGCNLKCSYCDTSYAQSINSGKNMEVSDIVNRVKEISIGNFVTLTGGEPLIHPNVAILIYKLCEEGFEVNVETNGSVVPPKSLEVENVFYTVDVKSPSSLMHHTLDPRALKVLGPSDVVKFVVGSYSDLEYAKRVIEKYNIKQEIYFSPVFGKIQPSEIVDFLKENKMFPCKIQLQLHKIIWDPEMRGV